MIVVHIAPLCTYTEGLGYQENLLPKYQVRLGHNVTLYVPNFAFKDGKKVEVSAEEYCSKDGFRVIRKQFHIRILGKHIPNLHSIFSVYSELKKLKPDYVFFHSLGANLIFWQVLKYKRRVNPSLILVRDNHLDRNISGIDNWKKRLWIFFDGISCRLTDKYVAKVYGVTRCRKEFARRYFGIPKEKLDVLSMGADDEQLNFARKNEIRERIRRQYGVKDDEFLIVTGGKIDKAKKTDLLIKACSDLPKVKILVFGSIDDGFREEFEKLSRNNPKSMLIGWIDSQKVYDYFFAADLVAFPGRHSVLWEQACASKVPCLFSLTKGLEHIDNVGNCVFLEEANVDNLRKTIGDLIFTKRYYELLEVARSEKTSVYLYSKIAQKTIADFEIIRNGR